MLFAKRLAIKGTLQQARTMRCLSQKWLTNVFKCTSYRSLFKCQWEERSCHEEVSGGNDESESMDTIINTRIYGGMNDFNLMMCSLHQKNHSNETKQRKGE